MGAGTASAIAVMRRHCDVPQLLQFIERDMRLAQVYQPVTLGTLPFA